ncbi:hypothetical protein BDF14DRAFT_1744803 [Spinellus fusiger]|nr:hypothetical protein BDF14DRAFT_1744803 [Spinellus fusiger]
MDAGTLAATLPDTNVYTAIYSTVNVFEMTVQGVAIMRRRSDSYMNATQILKLAGIDKGKRTKILDREVLTGEHEKVQGGYGKYQGTWIPKEKGKELAERYQVIDLILPLIEFDIDAYVDSGDPELIPTKEQALAVNKRLQTAASLQDTGLLPHGSPPMSPYCSAGSPATPPYRSSQPTPANNVNGNTTTTTTTTAAAAATTTTAAATHAHHHHHHHHHGLSEKEHHSKKRAKLSTVSAAKGEGERDKGDSANSTSDEHQRNILMNIFLSDESDGMTNILKHSKTLSAINIDLVIDEQGHTALHWSVAMAKLQTVEWLLLKGANACRVNYAGETPLMRGVMVTDCFDTNCFPKLLEILNVSFRITDHKNRTVLHHTALAAGMYGRTQAAMYYMRHVLLAMSSDNQLKAMVNSQDIHRETPLSIATRVGCKEMAELLILYGATQEACLVQGEESTAHLPLKELKWRMPSLQRPFEPSQQGHEIVSTVQKLVKSMESHYSGQVSHRDKLLYETQENLKHLSKQLQDTKAALEKRRADALLLEEARERIRKFERTLQAGWNSLDNDSDSNDGEDMMENDDLQGFYSFDSDSPSETETQPPRESSKPGREHKLERQVRQLQQQVDTLTKNDAELKSQMQLLRSRPSEKEIQCKRLIAACCNIPYEKIDAYLEPLLLVIESDPPDMDMSRVVGFMEKMKKAGMDPDTLLSYSLQNNESSTTAPSH